MIGFRNASSGTYLAQLFRWKLTPASRNLSRVSLMLHFEAMPHRLQRTFSLLSVEFDSMV